MKDRTLRSREMYRQAGERFQLEDKLRTANKRIEELEAELKEWESGALVRGWREIRADNKPSEDET